MQTASAFGVEIVEELGGRASHNWLVHRGSERPILRLDADLFELGQAGLGEAIESPLAWERGLGW